MMKNRLPLFAIPVLGTFACTTPGERTNGMCPQGEVCSPDTPNGLYFGGPPIANELNAGILPIAVGGTETVLVSINSSGTAFTRPFDAATTGALSVMSSTPPSVTVHADTTGNGYLRILQSGTNLLYDRVGMTTSELDHVDVDPIEMNGFNDDTFDPKTTPWAAWAGADVPVYMALYDGIETRLVDEALAVTGATSQSAWDTISVNGTSDIALSITAGDKSALPATVKVLAHVQTIAAVTASGVDPTKPQAINTPVALCFDAVGADGSTVIVGATWSFNVTSGTATAMASAYPNCASVTATAIGTVMLQVDAGDATTTVPIIFVAAKPTRAAAGASEEASATPGERAL
jgi:hypothetical protein